MIIEYEELLTGTPAYFNLDKFVKMEKDLDGDTRIYLDDDIITTKTSIRTLSARICSVTQHD